MAATDAGEESAGISREEMLARLDDPRWIIVDVLAPEVYDEGHVPGAINLPLPDLARRAPAVLPDRDREIAVYCAGHG